jgi:glycosidase
MSPDTNRPLPLTLATGSRLRHSGLIELSSASDLHTVRRLAHWYGGSGAELFALTVLAQACRATVKGCFDRQQLGTPPDAVTLGRSGQALAGVAPLWPAFQSCYLAEDLAITDAPVRRRVLAELFVIELLCDNPAASSFTELFADAELTRRCDYRAYLDRIDHLLGTWSGDAISGSPHGASLREILRLPVRSAPDDLEGQLAYIASHWRWLPPELLGEIKRAGAIVVEERRPHLPGPGPAQAPRLNRVALEQQTADFSRDRSWMSGCVLLAKSIHVWLGQLSDRYKRPITSLAGIPDEELERIASQGFSALWLIGIWQRSRASKRIKQLCGNPEAEASAYALHAYRVADELGGETALDELERRCTTRGIRLACDVVPNHTGIDSEWLLRHPDWFIQAEQPPYPAYHFSGPDLCAADDISLRIEDGYWDHSDAAVVFEHLDHATGQRRYIYHGNDGTHMPWNDTAQLNFLLPQVRAAMSDLIVTVARRFRLIRFDAAMTLARKHFRRLWFPPPGGAAGVPSRAACAVSDADFERAFPVEFWREVVDRVNREAPDTLLIAEAFWLMESYFVRTLGMHRVYNSAFMNLLKQEDNGKFRGMLKELLAYNPEILKRYVNFMNNPDEATAVAQFGKGDKYFCVATLLATLPGLPMFGHGQIEGFEERYGMEYRRAYWDEVPDQGFIAHHEQRIFPLLRMRERFAGVEDFSLYDFVSDQGVDDNVYAFSNGAQNDRVLVVCNNSAQATRGRIDGAQAKALPGREGQTAPMPRLAEAFALQRHDGLWRYRELGGDEYLLRSQELDGGLELKLAAYGYRVLCDLRPLYDDDGSWAELHRCLAGEGTDNLDRELLRIRHCELWRAFGSLLEPRRLRSIAAALAAGPPTGAVDKAITALIEEFDDCQRLIGEATGKDATKSAGPSGEATLKELLRRCGERVRSLSSHGFTGQLLAAAWQQIHAEEGLGAALLSWLLLDQLGRQLKLPDGQALLSKLEDFGLDFAWREGCGTTAELRDLALTRLLLRHPAGESAASDPALNRATFTALCRDPQNATLLGVNSQEGRRWFVRERMAAVTGALALRTWLALERDDDTAWRASALDRHRQRLARAAAVAYRLDRFLSTE